MTDQKEQGALNKVSLYLENPILDTHESFTIGAEEAAQILGVNRSRLSQLTSKGALHYEKRKIDTRNRLFYRLSDLLNYQRNQYATPPQQPKREVIFDAANFKEQSAQKNEHFSKQEIKHLEKGMKKPFQNTHRQSALELQKIKTNKHNIDRLQANVESMQQIITQQTIAIERLKGNLLKALREKNQSIEFYDKNLRTIQRELIAIKELLKNNKANSITKQKIRTFSKRKPKLAAGR